MPHFEHFQSVVSLISPLPLILRPIIVVVVVVEIPVFDVAVETISVAIETCMFEIFQVCVYLVGEDDVLLASIICCNTDTGWIS